MEFNKNLDAVEAYQAGKSIDFLVREFGIDTHEVIKLASNENPHGCSEKVSNEIQALLSKQMPLYPDDSFYELKNALSTHFRVGENNLIIGCGSDQIISFCIKLKASLKKGQQGIKNGKILINKITFPMYEINAHIEGLEVIKTRSLTHDIDEFKALYQAHQPDIVFLCIPNNPLGECLSQSEVYEFISTCNHNTLIVIDGAYQEYAQYKNNDKSIIPQNLIHQFNNVIYLGTFSKAYGLGGMRVGYGISTPHIIEIMHKLRPPFNITSLSLKAATIALQDQDFIRTSIANNFEQMNAYELFFKDMGIKYIDSYTNFISAVFPKSFNTTTINKTLLKRGIIIRNFAHINTLRITIGKRSQNEKVIASLKEILEEAIFS